MKVILWRRTDGGFSFTLTNTEDAAAAEEHAKQLVESAEHGPNHEGYTLLGVVDDTDMPDGGCQNKTSMAAAHFRDAWDFDGSKIHVDMPKAREVHKGRLRAMRAPKLAALDVEQLRGRDVAAQKQALRDCTADPRIAAAKTPAELLAVIPEVLA